MTRLSLVLRSALFNLAFYVNMIVLMLIAFPTMMMGRHAVFGLARLWARSSLWLLEKICGTRLEFRGEEHIVAHGAIIASKHQSIFETFALTLKIPDFSYVLKRELTWIPFFGWYLIAAEQIAINRSSGKSALMQIAEKCAVALRQGRSIFIFPEGTRRPVGAPPIYKHGVTHLYLNTGAPCTPVAINCGAFWPRRSFLRKPGLAVIEFLPPIPPGLDKETFAARLQEAIETKTDALVAEALAANPALARDLPSLQAKN
jgi:1-acyl-sn-glycerol-3-phosphate acyltransferase